MKIKKIERFALNVIGQAGKSAVTAHFNFGEKRPLGLFDVHQRKGLILRQIFPSLVVGHQISGIIQ